MNLFNFFKHKRSSLIEENQDFRKTECPYCKSPLAKIPSRKTKCVNCNKYIYVRTRPSDRAKVLVTKQQAEKIEEQWNEYHERKQLDEIDPMAFEKEKEQLRSDFHGQEPSEYDVRWRLLAKESLEHAKNNSWGLYRNTQHKKAVQLKVEKKYLDALDFYLEICYLNLNGPNNGGQIGTEYLPFDPRNGNGFLAPGIIEEVKQIISRLNLKQSAVKSRFLKRSQIIFKSMRLPLDPEECWVNFKQTI
jgi:uncharacterized Zn finger protein (UPF0148 family)